MKLTLQFFPEWDRSIEELFLTLNIPSVAINNSRIEFENLKFSIQDNSNSLILQTGERTEKAVSHLYNDLKIFRENFDKAINKATDPDINTLKIRCIINFRIRGIKILGKENAESQQTIYDQGLTFIKQKEEIQIIIPENYIQKPWKEFKKLMLQ